MDIKKHTVTLIAYFSSCGEMERLYYKCVLICSTTVAVISECRSVLTQVGIGETGWVSAQRCRCKMTTAITVAITHTQMMYRKYITTNICHRHCAYYNAIQYHIV